MQIHLYCRDWGDLDWNVPISSFILFHIRQDNTFFINSMLRNISKGSGPIIMPFMRNKKKQISLQEFYPHIIDHRVSVFFQPFEGSHLEAFSKPCFINQTIKRKGYMLYAITACRIIPSILLFKWEVIHGGSNRLIFF